MLPQVQIGQPQVEKQADNDTKATPEASASAPSGDKPTADAPPTVEGLQAQLVERDQQLATEKEGRATDTRNFRANQLDSLSRKQLGEQVTQMAAHQRIIAEHIAKGGDAASLQTALAESDRLASEATASADYQTDEQSLIEDSVGVHERLGLEVSISEHPEFATVRQFFQQAQQSKSPYWLAQAKAELFRTEARLAVANATKLTKKETKAAETKGAQQALDESEALDLSTPPGGGGAGDEDWRQLSGVEKIERGLKEGKSLVVS